MKRFHFKNTNYGAGIAATFWLVIVAFPIYYLVITSLRTQKDYLNGAVPTPTNLTTTNYQHVLDLGFDKYLTNSAIVTLFTVVLTIGLAMPAAYAIVRNNSKVIRLGFGMFLLGLAIPAQAVIIPIYLIITRMKLYDSLTAVVLPTVAFSLPVAMMVLTSVLRDIPSELYEAMTVEGAGTVRTFIQLALPLGRPGMISVGIFSGLNAWNGFLFPLVLTQSDSNRVITLGLWKFQGQYGTDVPGLTAAVLISALPILALYLFGRRYLLAGLAAGSGK